MNLLIGTIVGATREKLNNWLNSAIEHVNAKIVLISLDETISEEIMNLNSHNIEIVNFDMKSNDFEKNQRKTDVMFQRHYYISKYLESIEDHSLVLLTDVFDVVFQDDPFKWYKKNKNNKVLVTSEGLNHQHEPWNMRGMHNAYPMYVENVKNNDIINGGIIMGECKSVSDLCMLIYLLSFNVKPEFNEGIDQQSLNILMLSSHIKNNIQITNSSDNFAVNCAVAGPTEFFTSWGFKNNYKYRLPVFNSSGVLNHLDEPYCIVHQYNRIPEWNNFFCEKYKPREEVKEKIKVDNVTLVSALYNIGRENWKFSGFGKNNDRYKNWIKNFLSLNTNIVLFVDEYYYDYVLNLRSPYDPNNKKTKIIKISIDQLNFYQSFYNGISCLLFSPEFRKKVWFEVAEMKYTLYNIVNYAKIEFIKRARDLDNSNSSNFIWVDAGGFREDFSKYENLNWPTRISELYTGKVVHFTHNSNFNLHPNKDEYFRSQNRNIQGVCMIVPKDQVDFYYWKVYEEIELMIKEKTLGSDEKIYDSIYKKNSSSIDLIRCGWFGFFDLLKN